MEDKEYRAMCANLRDLMKTRSGKDIIWHVLSMCDLNMNAFMDDSLKTTHILGKQFVGLQIIQFLEDADPTIYPRLLLDKIEIGGENA